MRDLVGAMPHDFHPIFLTFSQYSLKRCVLFETSRSTFHEFCFHVFDPICNPMAPVPVRCMLTAALPTHASDESSQ